MRQVCGTEVHPLHLVIVSMRGEQGEESDTVTAEHLNNLDVFEELYRSNWFAAFRASLSGETVRLTRFCKSLSESEPFRASFRKDEASLRSLDHPSILQFIDWGEDDNGQLFYLTEMPVGTSLARLLREGRQLSWDEFTDIGWQISSAIQLAHNSGIAHGRLNTKSVIVSDQLRVKVAGIGLYRWIAASQSATEHSWPSLATDDLIGLGAILDAASDNICEETESAADVKHVAEMKDLISELKAPLPDLTARDVQGKLGNMLLGDGGDSIDMIDHREGQGLSRRSIVDELFDDPDSASGTSAPAVMKPASSRGCLTILAIAFIGVAVILLQF